MIYIAVLLCMLGLILPGCKVFKGPQITMCSTMTLPDVVARIPENTALIQTNFQTTVYDLKKIIKGIENLLDKDRDFYNTPAEMNRAWFLYQTQKNILHVLACLHQNASIRSAALSA